jgi:hypothetical protein
MKSQPSQAPRLRFNTKDDAINYANKVVEGLKEWAKRQGVRTPGENYIHSQCEIWVDVQFTAGRHPRNFKLVMQAIPLIDDDLQRSFVAGDGQKERSRVLEGSPNDESMRLSSEFGHRPQNAVAIPS